ncbi:MAG: PAS domain S-box protein [Bacteroidales bacterium]|nr:PAS domain S-box protein [Bacteroidales bacterium]
MDKNTYKKLEDKALKKYHDKNIDVTKLSKDEIVKAFQSLEIHQIELEMQNEELILVQKKLHETQQYYFNLFNSAPVGYLEINSDFKIIEANLTFSELINTEKNKIINSYFTNFICEDFQDDFYLALKNPQTKSMVLKIKNITNLNIWAKIDVLFKKNSQTYFLTISDITDLKIANQEKLENEKRYKHLFDSSPLGILVCNTKGDILNINKSALDILGSKSASESINNINIITNKATRKYGLSDVFLKCINEKQIKFIEKNYTSTWGKTAYLSAYLSPFINEYTNDLNIYITLEDITKRKQAEEKSTMLSNIVEQATTTIVTTDLDGNITYVNKAFENLTGYSYNEAIGQNPRILNAGKQSKNFFIELWDTILSGNVWKGEFINKKKNGEEFYEEALISPLIEENGTISGFFAVKKDITLRKIAENKLKESEEKYTILFEKSTIPTVLVNEDGGIAYFNEKAYKTLEYSKDEFAKLYLSDIDIYEKISDVKKRLSEISKKGYVEFETIHKTKNGNFLNIFVTSTLIKISGVKYYLSTFVDITHRITVEKKLKESEEKFRAIYEQASAGIIIANIDSKITDINPMMCQIIGYSKNELLALSVREIIHPDDVVLDYKRITKTIDAGEIKKTIQKRFIGKNGNTIWANVSIRVKKDEKNNPVGVILVIADITPQKNAENLLKENQKRLDLILNSFTEPVYVVSSDHKVIFANKAMKKQYGQKIFHQHCHKTIFDSSQECNWCGFNSLNSNNRVKTFELFFDRENKYKEVTNILLDNGNKLTVFHDITDLKKAQAEIKENEQKYIAIFEKALNPILVIDKDGFIVQFNEVAYKQLGYSKEEYSKLHISDIDLNDASEVVKERLQYIKKHRSFSFETKHITKSGEILDVFVKTSVIYIKNELFYLAIFDDVTPIKKAEEEIKNYSQKLKEAQKLSQMGNWELDYINNKLFFSDEICRILETNLQNTYNTYDTFLNFVYQQDKEMVKFVYDNSIKTKSIFEIENRIITKTGKIKFVKQKADHEFDKTGKLIYSRGVFIDITDAKKAQLNIIERDKYIKAINNITYLLLNKKDDNVFNAIVDILKKQLNVNNITIFKNISENIETIKIHKVAEFLNFNKTSKKDVFTILPKIAEKLCYGDIIIEKLENIDRINETIIKDEKISCFLAAPILTNRKLWGLMRFDIYEKNKKWNDTEISFIKTVSQDLSQHLERVEAENALKESEKKFRSLVQSQGEGVAITDMKENFVFANPAALSIFGVDKEGLIGKNLKEFVNKQQWNKILDESKKRASKLKSTYEITIQKPTGQAVILLVTATPHFSINNHVVGTLGIFRDITKFREQEKELKQALELKNILLKEVHHRVKNNLQTIKSLLFQQQYISENQTVKAVLQDSMNRVASMALIHEQIYKSENLDKIDVKKYIVNFSNQLFSSYRKPGSNISLNTNIDNSSLLLDEAIPMALILNELLSNAFKYAFIERSSGNIYIEFKEINKKRKLIVADNGVGLPKDFNIDNTKTLGMQIIKNIATRQLKGSLNINTTTEGTNFEIIF